MKIYIIALFKDLKKDEQGFLDYGGAKRVVGYFTGFEMAECALIDNWSDLHEHGYYNYAVIEEHDEGIHSICLKPIFYKWHGDHYTGGFKKIRRPKITKGFIGFTIG